MPRISAASIAEHTAKRRQRILDAAAQLIRAVGYDRVELADIARAAGLARNSIYKYFSGKDELLFASLMPALERALAERQQAILAEPAPIERLLLWQRLTMGFIGGPDHELVELLSRIPLAPEKVRARMLELLTPLIEQLRADFADAMAGSGLSAELWIEVFDEGARAAARYGRERGRLTAVTDEVQKVLRGFFMTRYAADGRIAGHVPAAATVEFAGRHAAH